MPHPTIQDIAKDLGISKMTVSRALRGVGRVKESTRRQVREKARELGYLGSPDVVFGQPVHRGTSDHSLQLLLPVVTPSRKALDGPIAQAVARGIRDRLAINAGKLDVMPCATLEEILAAWNDHKSNGIVLREQLPAKWIARLRERGPVVYASSHDFYGDIDAVYTNELRSATQMQSFLQRRGCESIAWMGLFDRHQLDSLPEVLFDQLTAREREHFSIHGPRYAAWTYLTHGSPDNRVYLLDRDWHQESLDETIARGIDMILRNGKVDAIVTPSTPTAESVVHQLTALGFKVPEEIGVAGYGLEAPVIADGRQLTTVLLPMYDIGRAVPDLIERRLVDPDALPLTLLFQTSLAAGTTVRHV